MWQRRWWGLAAAWVGAIAGAVALVMMPDKYEASARVFVDTDSILKPLMSGLAVQPNVQQQISIVTRTLLSRPNMEKLVRTTDLDLGLRTARDKDSLIDDLLGTIKLSSAGQNNLYIVTYRDPQPEKARRVVQSLVSMFVESSLGDSRKDADTARRFIEEQIQSYEKKLAEAENRVKEFKLRNMGLMNTDGRDFFARMGALSRADQQGPPGAAGGGAVPRRHEARARGGGIVRSHAGTGGSAPRGGDRRPRDRRAPPVVEAEPRRHAAALYRQAPGRRQHPARHRRARGGEEEGDRGPQAEDEGRRTARMAGNPVAQQLKIALAESEANVASARAQLAEYEARFNQARGNAQRVPEIEAELAALNRDYEVQRRNYEQLVTRRESVQLAGELDSTSAVDRLPDHRSATRLAEAGRAEPPGDSAARAARGARPGRRRGLPRQPCAARQSTTAGRCAR